MSAEIAAAIALTVFTALAWLACIIFLFAESTRTFRCAVVSVLWAIWAAVLK
jgi:hypothetical protein